MAFRACFPKPETGLPPPQPAAVRPERPKVLVIGNCQSAGYAYFLNLFCPDIQAETFQVESLSPERRKPEIDSLIARKHDYEAVFCLPLSEAYGAISTPKLHKSLAGVRVYKYTNVYFSGLTPDLTYVGDFHSRCVGPLGDYHSKIAFYGYMSGMSPDETLALFRPDVMARMGFFAEYEASKTRLIGLDAHSDVGITDLIFPAVQDELLFLANNHPTTRIFFDYARRMAACLKAQGLTRVRDLAWSPLAYPNMLAFDAVFPVYPEVASVHGLGYGGCEYYKAPGSPVLFDRRELVFGEFAAFEAYGRDRLEALPVWQEISQLMREPSGRGQG